MNPTPSTPPIETSNTPNSMADFFRIHGLDLGNPSERAMFQPKRVEPSSSEYEEATQHINAAFFQVVGVFQIVNEFLLDAYMGRQKAVAFQSNHATGNERVLYHVTKAPVFDICENGLDCRYSLRGYFGYGLYLSDDPLKANDYGATESLYRVVLRCKTLLGNTKEFEMGHFDRDMKMEPKGFHSVQGYLRRSVEYVIYRNDQVYVDHVIVYKCTDAGQEQIPSSLPTQVLPPVHGKLVYITAGLSEFFSKLKSRAGAMDSEPHKKIKRVIGLLLKQLISIDQFLQEVAVVLQAVPPTDLNEKLKMELGKCDLVGLLGNNGRVCSPIILSPPEEAD